jgi:hypothetical protein
MKTSTIQIGYSTEKLDSIRCYLKDEAELQTELTALLQTLYEKHVPKEVQERIESDI